MTYPYGVVAMGVGATPSTATINLHFFTKKSGSWAVVDIANSLADTRQESDAVANDASEFLLAVHLPGVRRKAYLFQSLDEGDTWAEVSTHNLEFTGDIVSMYIVETLWCLLVNNGGSFRTYTSEDGAVWTARSAIPSFYGTASYSATPHSMLDSQNRLHVVSMDRYAYTAIYNYSDDAGITWGTTQTINADYSDNYGLAVSGSNLVFAGTLKGLHYIEHSVSLDRGETWTGGTLYENRALFTDETPGSSAPSWSFTDEANAVWESATPLLILNSSLYMLASTDSYFYDGSTFWHPLWEAASLIAVGWAAGLPTWNQHILFPKTALTGWAASATAQSPTASDGVILLCGPTDRSGTPNFSRTIYEVNPYSGGRTLIYSLLGSSGDYGTAQANEWGLRNPFFSWYRVGLPGGNVNVYFF